MASAVACLLRCLPLLRTGNAPAKAAYLQVLPVVLRRSTETGLFLPECQQILSYALIHPAISGDELIQLNAWQPQLHDDLSGTFAAEQPEHHVMVNGLSTASPTEVVSNGAGGQPMHRDLSATRSLPVGLLHDSPSSSLVRPPSRNASTAAAVTGGAVHLQHSSSPTYAPRALTPPRLGEFAFLGLSSKCLYSCVVKQVVSSWNVNSARLGGVVYLYIHSYL